MRSLLALLASVALVLGATACGGPSQGTSAASLTPSSVVQASPNGSNSDSTGSTTVSSSSSTPHEENDDDDHRRLRVPGDDRNNGSVRSYGHAATAADTQAIGALLKRYYAIALTGDGAKGCSMLSSGLLKAAPLDFGRFGAPYLRGAKTCAAVLSRMFKHEHRKLIAEVPHLKLISVRLEGEHGLVLLGFGRLPERAIAVLRQGGVWKVESLLDGELE